MNKTISDSKVRFAAYRKALYDCEQTIARQPDTFKD
jgi:hypothetical protein